MSYYYSVGNLFFIKALTSLHVGLGRSISEEVDLPFQRDELGYPTIYSSSLKGAIKSYLLRTLSDKRHAIYTSLGKDEEPTESSYVAFLDAILFAIPARFLKLGGNQNIGPWVYITSKELINKFKNYVRILDNTNCKIPEEFKNLELDSQKAVCISNCDNLNDGEQVLINERLFEITKSSTKIDLRFTNKPLIVLDDSFNSTILRSKIIVNRIRIDREKKTVVEGSLWSEEYVPINTVFASAMLIRDSNNEEKKKEVMELYQYMRKSLKNLVIGGKETIGKGIVEVIWFDC